MAMTLVSTVTVGSGGAASIEFTNIPQTGKDLLLLVSTRTAYSAGQTVLALTINNVFTSNYNMRTLIGSGSAASSDNLATSLMVTAVTNSATSTSNTFGNASFYFSNYTSSTNKSLSIDSVSENNATAAGQRITAGSFTTSSAITSFKMADASGSFNFVQHSTASLYIIS
jgi:pyocin large subunit-like protein